MPENEYGICFGDETEQKHRDVSGLASWFIAAAKPNIRYGQRFRYFDLNAARPHYSGGGNDYTSSAVTIVEKLRRFNVPYSADLFEINADNAFALLDYFRGDDNVNVHAESSVNLTMAKNATAPGYYGMMYADPNTPTQLPIDEILKFYESRNNNGVDFVLNIAAASLKRVNGLNEFEQLRDIVGKLDARKSNWLIREPHDRQQWTMIVGSNWGKMKDWSKRGFYRMSTDIGKSYWYRVAYTEQERKAMEQPSLGFI